eukprot:CAMPEP_0184373220 /NCGR_PEP_ID=MMETSP1089-20130417/164378_1 /TAXON_ID=38269 ORGANISM="Gloeochaete wittrockiana, Strain SAG46.84" /NCGR_SAMPLE_ID=MMETSP1089 /ASSEMBLY_ACC=CAM_ASM_000445 /LENGTH=120 /DNA_ID=CAMNT_0026716149 /DNA_START=437 /DNA_END=799 /DNA_ORIENTATION=-
MPTKGVFLRSANDANDDAEDKLDEDDDCVYAPECVYALERLLLLSLSDDDNNCSYVPKCNAGPYVNDRDCMYATLGPPRYIRPDTDCRVYEDVPKCVVLRPFKEDDGDHRVLYEALGPPT